MDNTQWELTTPENKNIPIASERFLQKAKELVDNLLNAREKFKELVDIGHKDGLEDYEIDMILKNILKEKLPKSTLYDYRKEFLHLESPKRSKISHNKVVEQSSITNTEEDKPKQKPDIIDVESEQVMNEEFKDNELEPFWIEYRLKLGSIERKLRLLIDPLKKKWISDEVIRE